MEALKNLEEKVHAARRRLEAVDEQNRGLKSKVRKLETELAESAGAGDWRRERVGVRKRVAELAATLESLI